MTTAETADNVHLVSLRPATDDLETAGFWAAAQERRLVVRACTKCGAVLHLPRPMCRECHSFDLEWREVAGHGTVYTSTIVEHQVHPSYPVPYTVLVIELDDAPSARLIGSVPGRVVPPAGTPAHARWETMSDGTVVPQWELD
jgi:uncharacterized OB-fold protein